MPDVKRIEPLESLIGLKPYRAFVRLYCHIWSSRAYINQMSNNVQLVQYIHCGVVVDTYRTL
nr:MAG TPA: hypothetical protein [Caudoviricetes sp.]